MKHDLFLDFFVLISYNQEMKFTNHEHIKAFRETIPFMARRVIVTLYAAESAWLVVPAFIVVAAVIIHDIISRRRGGGSGKSRDDDRGKDGW